MKMLFFIKNKKVIDLNKQLKNVGINSDNLVVGPRLRKTKETLDL